MNARKTSLSGSGLKNLRCRNLTTLWLSGAEITDGGITSLASFPKLKEIFLEDTKVTDAVIPTLAKMSSLESVGLASCAITDKGLLALAPLRKLQRLELDSTPISDSGIAVVRNFGNLRHLDLEKTRVSDKCLALLPARLEGLILNRCTGITSAAMTNIVRQRNLLQLNISFTSIRSDAVGKLGVLSAMRDLDLAGIRANDQDLLFLEKLALRRLSLAGTNAGEATIARLKKPGIMEELELTGTAVGDSAIPDLAKLKRLRLLDISNTNITADGNAKLKKLLPNCQIGYM